MDNFNDALAHVMLYEVGGFFKLTDKVRVGLIATPAQRKSVGYTIDPTDRGGETKFGVAKNANPTLNITTLNWDSACLVYYQKYWLAGACNKLPSPYDILHFDGCINHGVGRQTKFLQRAVGVVEDGQIGPGTLAAVAKMDVSELISKIADIRRSFYQHIIDNDLKQAKYRDGWFRRINEMEVFTKSKL